MPQRKLNKQQQTRITNKLELNQKTVNTSQHEQLGKPQTGLVITSFGKKILVEATNGNLYKCSIRQHLGKIVAGDIVTWQTDIEQNTGIVSALKPRTQELSRPGFRGETKMIAANIDLLGIIAPVTPGIYPDMLDRYLVIAHQLKLTVFIIINKIDLIIDDKQWDNIAQTMLIYDKLGIKIYPVSATTGKGIDTIQPLLAANNSVFVGPSGAGKSSLINYLIPNVKIKTNQLSESTGLGKHTTTNSILYHLPKYKGKIGNIIDSPGVRQFTPAPCSLQELEQAYQDFEPFLGKCKFNNCTHTIEPNCAIQQAVEDGQIHFERYQSFQRLMDEFK